MHSNETDAPQALTRRCSLAETIGESPSYSTLKGHPRSSAGQSNSVHIALYHTTTQCPAHHNTVPTHYNTVPHPLQHSAPPTTTQRPTHYDSAPHPLQHSAPPTTTQRPTHHESAHCSALTATDTILFLSKTASTCSTETPQWWLLAERTLPDTTHDTLGVGWGTLTNRTWSGQAATDLCTVLTEMLTLALVTSTDRHTSDNLARY